MPSGSRRRSDSRPSERASECRVSDAIAEAALPLSRKSSGPVLRDVITRLLQGSRSHAPRDHRSILSVTLDFMERLVGALEQGVDERVSLRVSLRVRHLRAAIRSMGRRCFRCPCCVTCYRPNTYRIDAVALFLSSGAFCRTKNGCFEPTSTAMYCFPLTE
jgi:hypothetical protein